MSKLKPVGLIASGRMIESPLTRFPSLARDLGPVVASSRRLASRYAGALRAGQAADVPDLAHCSLVLIQAPAPHLPAALSLLLKSPVSWKSKVLVLLDEDMDTTALQPLRDRRAAVGSMTPAPSPDNRAMVVEGDPAAVSALRAWAARAQLRCVELTPQCKALYAAGLMVAGSLLSPVLDGSLRCLRASGLSQPEARRILEHVVELAIRDQRAHGRKAWASPASPARRPVILAQLSALAEVDPVLALFYQRSLIAALDYLGQDADWLGEPPLPGHLGPD